MTQGITLRVSLPADMMAIVPDEGAQAVTSWSFARVRGVRETWHLVGHLGDKPWVSSEVLAVDPKLDLVVARPGVAFLVGDRVQFAKGAIYRIVGQAADPTPAMRAALHKLLDTWEPPQVRHHAWAAMLELPPGDHPGRPAHVVDQWHVVRRTEGILVIGWELPGQWEPILSGLLAWFDPLTDTAADVGGRAYKMVAPAEGFMHPLVEDFLKRMSGPGPSQDSRRLSGENTGG